MCYSPFSSDRLIELLHSISFLPGKKAAYATKPISQQAKPAAWPSGYGTLHYTTLVCIHPGSCTFIGQSRGRRPTQSNHLTASGK